MAKTKLKIAATLVAAAGLAVAGSWFFLAAKAERTINAWAEAGRADGIETNWATLEISGFPLRLRGTLAEPTILMRNGADTVFWQAPVLTVEISPLSPDRLRFEVSGRHAIVKTGADGTVEEVSLAVADGWVEIEQADGEDFPQEIALHFVGVTATFGDHPVLAAGSVEGEFRRYTGRRDGGGNENIAAAVAHLRIQGLDLPQGVTGPFDPHIEIIEFDLALAGVLPERAYRRPRKTDIAAWRDGGGYLVLRNAHIDWGSLSARADGRIELDSDLQPTGQIETRATGLMEAVRTMEAGALIDANTAMVARLAITGLNALGRNEQTPEGDDILYAPLTLADGAVRLGPLKLARIPTVKWRQ